MHRHHPFRRRCRCYGVRTVQWGSRKERGAITNHDKRRGSCFLTHQVGPPTLWVPPSSVSLHGSSVDRAQTAHIPLERGGAAAAASSLVRELQRR